ncbi:CBU_0592 family membrane protein [Emticicia soli]|uniref:CBU-0592-like domain-containing protein n=1 Tax=Emticicia soli TaxID=2027878 RepID=A0ABW5J6Y2_9BACT
MKIDLVEIVGWIGAVLITGSYFLNIQGKLDAKDKSYIWANAIGGICFIINTYFHQAYPSMAVNIIWVLIALAAIIRKK